MSCSGDAIISCESGLFLTLNKQECINCQDINNSINAVSCDETKITKCKDGFYLLPSFKQCKPCPVDTSSWDPLIAVCNGTEFVVCTFGLTLGYSKFNLELGEVECKPCETDKFCNGTHVVGCPSHQFVVPVNDVNVCEDCPDGWYCDG